MNNRSQHYVNVDFYQFPQRWPSAPDGQASTTYGRASVAYGRASAMYGQASAPDGQASALEGQEKQRMTRRPCTAKSREEWAVVPHAQRRIPPESQRDLQRREDDEWSRDRKEGGGR
ncbi:hypothetical protein B0H17DRAFT_1104258 [Mycena rosella]|uniref:Uncharacterized protein n=1 Tax=Mycena rosella TaxID=1033263 RepID=A0AAD7CCW2_MYCRO|nr:hypothetical protein B0H17DRAFT_1104258 [Mycena rosella]